MRTKIVYVLVSSDDDLYLEQAFLSVYSLKMYSPDTSVELIVDKVTDNTLINGRSSFLQYFSNKIVVDVPDEYKGTSSSRWLKTNLRNIVDGDYLYVDTDTIIVDNLEAVDALNGDICAVLDLHGPHLSKSARKDHLRWSIRDGWTFSDTFPYYNSGVMLVKDTSISRHFYEEWHQRWLHAEKKYNFLLDQSSLAATNEAQGMLIHEMPGIWNCQLMYYGLPYFSNAKIIHHIDLLKLNSKCAWKFYNLQLYLAIKRNHTISSEVDDMLRNVKTQFDIQSKIIGKEDINLLNSFGIRVLKRIGLF